MSKKKEVMQIDGRIKKMEASLQESEERFRQFFENSPVYCYVISPDEVIIDINKAMLERVGYKKKEIIGKSLLTFYTDASKQKAKRLLEKWKKTGELRNEELNIVSKDGAERTVLLSADVVRNAKGEIMNSILVQTEITERKKAEQQIKNSLKEKETFLKETNHRVKNNLQIISSLLSLQLENVKNKEMVKILEGSQNRIRSIALIHEKFYQSEDYSKINITTYIESLVTQLYDPYKSTLKKVKIYTKIDTILLDMDSAISLGLIINELVSNSLRHAFPQDRKGEIKIELKSNVNNEYSLIISDNGIGIPEDIDFKNSKSLGLQLVNTLTNQLDGSIELEISKGTKITITFAQGNN